MNNIVKERLRAALTRCKKKDLPDYFIFINKESWTWDEPSIFGITVLHVSFNISFTPWGDSDLPLIPCWNNEGDCKKSLAFERLYDES
ncbi:MAG: hypothetical protein ACTSSO_07125 [Candidatus Hodarchaeales archaeon]